MDVKLNYPKQRPYMRFLRPAGILFSLSGLALLGLAIAFLLGIVDIQTFTPGPRKDITEQELFERFHPH